MRQFYDDEDDEFYGEEDDDLYYDDEDEDDEYYYDEEVDSNEGFDNVGTLAAPVIQQMQISVDISELKQMNDLDVIPTEHKEHDSEHDLEQKVDNDLESSDLGFSEGHIFVDEQAYQIGELGEFEIEKSLNGSLEGINSQQSSVEFSEGAHLSADFGEISQEAEYDQSS